MRNLVITQNITVDGSIEMLGDWFDPRVPAKEENADLLDELHHQDSQADGFLVEAADVRSSSHLLARSLRRPHGHQ